MKIDNDRVVVNTQMFKGLDGSYYVVVYLDGVATEMSDPCASLAEAEKMQDDIIKTLEQTPGARRITAQ